MYLVLLSPLYAYNKSEKQPEEITKTSVTKKGEENTTSREKGNPKEWDKGK